MIIGLETYGSLFAGLDVVVHADRRYPILDRLKLE